VGVVVAPKSNHPLGAHILAREMIWVGPEKVFGFCFVCGHERCVARDFFVPIIGAVKYHLNLPQSGV
jgi:hypothetical protein